MPMIRTLMNRLLILLVLILTSLGAHAADDDWTTVSRMLAVAQTVLSAALSSPPGDTRRSDAVLDSILEGRNADANAVAGEMFADMPASLRSQVAAVARSALSLSRRQAQQTSPVPVVPASTMSAQEVRAGGMAAGADRTAIAARRDLNAMGNRYHVAGEFLDAVRRDDVLAARLYIAGRGLDARAIERGRDLASSPAMKALLAGG